MADHALNVTLTEEDIAEGDPKMIKSLYDKLRQSHADLVERGKRLSETVDYVNRQRQQVEFVNSNLEMQIRQRDSSLSRMAMHMIDMNLHLQLTSGDEENGEEE